MVLFFIWRDRLRDCPQEGWLSGAGKSRLACGKVTEASPFRPVFVALGGRQGEGGGAFVELGPLTRHTHA